MNKILRYLSILSLILLSLTPVVWFWGRGQYIINGVDTNFPMNPQLWFLRRFFVWNDNVNAGLDFSSSVSGMFFHLIQFIPYKLGFDLHTTQILSLVFWFSMIVLGSYILARLIVPKLWLLQILFVCLYSFNIYMFNTWENIKVANLSLVATIPFVIAILVMLKNKQITRITAALSSSLIAIVFSGSGINPAYFFCLYLIISILLLSELLTTKGLNNFKEVFLNYLTVCLVIFMVNLFWFLPTVNFILGNISTFNSIDKLGFTNWVDSLSENTSILNVLRLQGAWDWYAFDASTYEPLYIPYAINYFNKLPFVLFSFLIPSLVLVSFSFMSKENRYLYLAFGLMVITGVFLGAGTHLPSGTVYRWFINYVPFFSIFRSPWYIFTPMVTLAYASLVSLLFYGIYKKVHGKNSVATKLIPVAVIILIIGNLVYSYPLVLGKIFRFERNDSFFVKFPDYTFEAQKWLNGQPSHRVIGYPDDEIERFTWGYRGIESILTLFSNKETLFSPLNMPDSGLSQLIKEFYWHLKRNEVQAAFAIGSKMDLGLILEKGDQESLSSALPESVKRLPNNRFDKWTFYQISDQYLTPKIYSAENIFFGFPYKEGVKMVTTLNKSDILIDPKDGQLSKISNFDKLSGSITLAENSQLSEYTKFQQSQSNLQDRLTDRQLSGVNFKFWFEEDNVYQPILEKYKLENFGISLQEPLDITLDGQKSALFVENVSDSYVYFKPMFLSKGEHNLDINIGQKGLVIENNFSKDYKPDLHGEGQAQVANDGEEYYLSILNKDKKDTYVNFRFSEFDPLSTYYVSVKYRQIYGNNATVIFQQDNDFTLVKSQVERLPNYPGWQTFGFYVEPVRTKSKAKVALISPATKDPLGTTIQYDDLITYRVFTNQLLFIHRKDSTLVVPKISYKKVSPVEYEGTVEGAIGPHMLVFSENYNKQWEIKLSDQDEHDIRLNPVHLSGNIYANAWYMDKTPQKYKFQIYYTPQKLLLIGGILSVTTILLCLGLYLLKKIK